MSKLLYIGRKYPKFVEEAEKYGISRNVPFAQASKLKWGELVQCAKYDGYNEWELDCADDKIGRAKLLCDFKFTQLYIKDKEFLALLLNEKDIHEHITDFITADTPIKRVCGTYTVTASVEIDMPAEDLFEKAKELLRKHNIKAPKVMIGGKLNKKYTDDDTYEGMRFSRGLVTINDDTLEVQDDNDDKCELVLINDYVKYSRKEQRQLIKNMQQTTIDDYGVLT